MGSSLYNYISNHNDGHSTTGFKTMVNSITTIYYLNIYIYDYGYSTTNYITLVIVRILIISNNY